MSRRTAINPKEMNPYIFCLPGENATLAITDRTLDLPVKITPVYLLNHITGSNDRSHSTNSGKKYHHRQNNALKEFFHIPSLQLKISTTAPPVPVKKIAGLRR
jgi:hypothetical protein